MNYLNLDKHAYPDCFNMFDLCLRYKVDLCTINSGAPINTNINSNTL